MRKVKLSSKQIENLRNTISSSMTGEYSELQGRLLTTMDSAVENDRQVEGLKSRIRDIQGRLWDEIYRQKESILGSIFFSDATKPTKESVSDIEKAIEKFIMDLNSTILGEFEGFFKRLKCLMGMIFSDSKLECMVGEVDRIVRSSRFKLMRRIARNLRDNFGISDENDTRISVSK